MPSLPFRVLLTGFEPFGGLAANPSAVVCAAVAAAPPPGLSVRGAILPTAFDRAAAVLHALLDAGSSDGGAFDAVLLLGLAGGRRGLTVERVAINLRDARIPDNDGHQPIDQPCIAGAPTAHLSTLPVKRMAAAIRAAGLEAAVSHSAGTFVCNHVLFTVLHRAAALPTPIPRPLGAFLHLPFLPDQAGDEPSLPLDDQLRGVRAALAALPPGAAEHDTSRPEGTLH
ncbi:MAG: pyroglutamyl-peptidase I [Gluconacetobacter diazotrophicus]|nr:pyroglutamyl-peptidase I [Gluconacetobacter diazotrophicus]